jgi:type IV pilus assembly protein PilB
MRDFTDLLLSRGIISLEQLSEAAAIAKKDGKPIGDCLVDLQYASPEDVTRALAEFNKFEYVDLTTVKIPDQVIQLVPESVARENKIIPYAELEDSIRVLVSDPFDIETIEKLRFILNRKVETALAPKEHIQEAINRYYGQTEGESADSMLQEFTDTQIDFTETEQDKIAQEEQAEDDSAPVVRLVHYMISEAVQLRASDIHVEPFETRVRIRYRIDGVLVERDSPPRRLLGAIMSRIKILAKMDIAERRRPQDGRIKITVGEKELDLRVSIIPTNHGQSCVMRLLDKDNIKVGVKQLGLSDRDFKLFTGLIKRPNGILLVTGPTGSGKTTTLYASLNALNRPDRKIITAEDPVEYYLPGINQVEVRHNIGLDFARIIRAMLRQAPNVILVGEMRDTETAQMGIQASLTGHLVFSTLHTNDAPSSITRLIDMGVAPFLVASSVMAIMAQRLVRVNCPKCVGPTKPDPRDLEYLEVTEEQIARAKWQKGKGCSHCQHTGYRGRKAVFELMTMNSMLRDMTFKQEPSQNLRRQAMMLGMKTLVQDALDKAVQGLTTIPEVMNLHRGGH